MSLPPPNIARQDESDQAAWEAQERALRGDPVHEVAAAGILRMLSAVPAIGAVLIMFLWVLGNIASDRTWWTQFLEWTPTVAVLPVAGLLLLAGEAGRRLLIRTRPAERTLPRLRKLMIAGGIFWAAILVYFVQAELGATRAIGLRPHLPAGASATRLLFWNSGAEDLPAWTANIIAARPDICVFTSLKNEGEISQLAEAMSPDPVKFPTWTFSQDRFTVLSRSRILRAGFTRLSISKGGGLDPREQGPNRYYDPGRAMFVEIEPSLFAGDGGAPTGGDAGGGRSIVVWVVDLPSDLSLPRGMVTEQAAAAIRAYHGPVITPDASGRWLEQESVDMRGFPPPDFLVGDFNIPRGSHSLGAITGMHTPALNDAWHEAGYGYTATYPRHRPLWHSDQIFIHPRYDAVGYETLNVGCGTHRLVWVDLVIHR